MKDLNVMREYCSELLLGPFRGDISPAHFIPVNSIITHTVFQRALPWLQLLEGLGQNLKKGLFLYKFWLKWAPSTSAEKINNCPISYSQQVFINNSQSLYCEFICQGLNWEAAPKTCIKITTKYSFWFLAAVELKVRDLEISLQACLERCQYGAWWEESKRGLPKLEDAWRDISCI